MYQFSHSDIEAIVLKLMTELGCAPIDNKPLILDGVIHRYKVEGDTGSETSGAYCIYLDHLPAGWFCNWRIGIIESWHMPREALSKEGRAWFTDERYKEAYKLAMEHQEQLKKEREEKQKNASFEASKQFELMTQSASQNFPYLQRKGVKAYGLKLFAGNTIVIPLRNIQGQIQTLQYIDENGEKRFFPDAPVKGAFFSIDLSILALNTDAPILICEGYATLATIYECTFLPTVAAMNCYNLLPVAEAIKKKYPNRKILILADNDRHADGTNPGLEHARKACEKLGLQGVIYPHFERDEKGSDWNDYAAIHGLIDTSALLKKRIEEELRPQRIKDIYKETEIINAQELRKIEFAPIKWAVEGFLPSGLTILGGAPKVGKSIFVLHLAIAVAIGGCALGKIDVEQGDVLYLALEDNRRRLQERIIASSTLPENANISRLDLVTRIPRQHKGGLEFIEWWLIHHPEARLVIIDTLQKFRKQLSGKGGVYGEDYEAASEIKALADKYDVAFLANHHLKKMSRKDAMADDWINYFSGSAGLSGSADTLFVLTRDRSGNRGILRRTGRDVEEKDFSMRLDQFGWVLEGEAEAFTMPEWKKQILDYLKEHETVSPIVLSQACNLDQKTAQKNLQRLSKEGLIVKTGFGTYTLKNDT